MAAPLLASPTEVAAHLPDDRVGGAATLELEHPPAPRLLLEAEQVDGVHGGENLAARPVVLLASSELHSAAGERCLVPVRLEVLFEGPLGDLVALGGAWDGDRRQILAEEVPQPPGRLGREVAARGRSSPE